MSKIFFTHIYFKTIFPVKYWSQLLPDKKITKRIRDKNTKNAILPLFWAYIGQPDNHELEISVFCLFLSWPLFLVHSYSNQSQLMGDQGWNEILMITLISNKKLGVCRHQSLYNFERHTKSTACIFLSIILGRSFL